MMITRTQTELGSTFILFLAMAPRPCYWKISTACKECVKDNKGDTAQVLQNKLTLRRVHRILSYGGGGKKGEFSPKES